MRQALALIRELQPEFFGGLGSEGLRAAIKKTFEMYGNAEANPAPVESLSSVRANSATAVKEIQELFDLWLCRREEEDANLAAGVARFAAERADYELQIASLKHELAAERLAQAERIIAVTCGLKKTIIDLHEALAESRRNAEQLEIRLRQRIQESSHRPLIPQKHLVGHGDID
jgi:hypothetical protein